MSNQNNGIMTKIWGPPGWLFLHCITMGYPIKINDKNKDHTIRKTQTKLFFEALGDVMPCGSCRQSYKEYIKDNPINNHLSSRKDLAKWFYDIHNLVNDKLNIHDNIPTFNEFYERYEMYRAPLGQDEDNIQPLKKKTLIQIVDKDGNDFCFNKTNDIKQKDTELIFSFLDSWNYELLKLLSPSSQKLLLSQVNILIDKGLCNDERGQQIIKILSKDKPCQTQDTRGFEVVSINDL
tara:strand:- start:451 stop:1158 length:708 start_codon:yes stop_codon:yes gene_type:complete